MPMANVIISEFEVTDPGMYYGPTTTTSPPVTVIEDVVCCLVHDDNDADGL